MWNCLGATMDDVRHYIQFAIKHRIDYLFEDEAPADPHEDTMKSNDGSYNVIMSCQIMKFEVEEKAKAHLVTLQKYASGSKKAYA